MAKLPIARVGLYLAPQDPLALWYREALEHCGLMHFEIADLNAASIEDCDVLILAGDGELNADEQRDVLAWLDGSDSPRALVALTGSWGLAERLGINPIRIPAATLRSNACPIWPDGATTCKVVGGYSSPIGSSHTILSTRRGQPIVTKNDRAYWTGYHLGATCAAYLHGTPVEGFGVGSEEGDVFFDTLPLKAEYATRFPLSERQDGVFLHAHVDVAREIILRLILEAIDATEKRGILLWHLPKNLSHAAVVSVETDITDNESLHMLNNAMMMVEGKFSVYARPPSLNTDTCAMLRRFGHSVAYLHDPVDKEDWHPDRIKLQMMALSRTSGLAGIGSMRFAGGQWRGGTLPYHIAESAGVKLMSSRGPEQAGTTGFTFGTCHAFAPLMRSEKPSNLLECPYQVRNPGVTSPESRLDPILSEVQNRHGVLQTIVDLSVVADPNGFKGLRDWLAKFKQSGGDFISLDQWYRYEMGRRKVQLSLPEDGLVHVVSGRAIDGLTLLVTGRALEVSSLMVRTMPQTVIRYGREMTGMNLIVPENRLTSLRLTEYFEATA